MKQTFSQKATRDCLDTRLFTADQLLPGSRPPSYFPVLVILESVSEAEIGTVTAVEVTPAGADFSDRHLLRSQLTFAALERDAHGVYAVKVVGQKLQIDSRAYFLEDVYGVGSSALSGAPGGGSGVTGSTAAVTGKEAGGEEGTECVVCLTEPRDTILLPCRHMCLCHECGNQLRLKTNKCPVCRNGALRAQVVLDRHPD
jgi:E3 ubiquitin-protein ligase MGRN1